MNWSPQPDPAYGSTDAAPRFDITNAPAPLFSDPVFNAPADPSIIWNHASDEWWLLYTQRRATVHAPARSQAHGTAIGIASSADNGTSWLYRGTLGLDIEPGHNTFWAPDILWHDGTYHLFVSFIRGVPQSWSGERHIAHCTSTDLWNWAFESFLSLGTEYAIDPDVYRLPSGTWHMWFKGEAGTDTGPATIHAADSDDLYSWRALEEPTLTDRHQEAPNVFAWNGSYWLLTDPGNDPGLGVYRSEDAETWTRQDDPLLAEPGTRTDDGPTGCHPDVLVRGDRAFVFYHVHHSGTEPSDITEGGWADSPYRTTLQVAELHVTDGRLHCDRDEHAQE